MNFLIIFIGGGLGALTRYIMTLMTPKFTYFPESTLMANFFGCFIATVVFVYLVSKSNTDSVYKMFFITGFCGGLSTLSALSIELLDFIHSEEYFRAFAYSVVTIFICSLSVFLGLILTKYCLHIKL
jgi:CrcB protein